MSQTKTQPPITFQTTEENRPRPSRLEMIKFLTCLYRLEGFSAAYVCDQLEVLSRLQRGEIYGEGIIVVTIKGDFK